MFKTQDWSVQLFFITSFFSSMSTFLALLLSAVVGSTLLVISGAVVDSCSSSRTTCPPFTSTPLFPFSSSPGCGHPDFQIKCGSLHSFISINNLSFALLDYQPNSTTLSLSPQTVSNQAQSALNCSYSRFNSIPSRSIDLSGSPFRISDASCSRLSNLRACSPLNLPNCSHCPWDCKLVKNPTHLLQDCGSTSHHALSSEQGCQDDVLEFLDGLLTKQGIQVEFDVDQDSYFTRCKACQGENGVCGFDSSDPSKPFLCFHSKSRLSPPWIHEKTISRVAIFSCIFALICLLLGLSFGVSIFRSRMFKSSSSSEEDPTTLFLHRHRSASLLPPVFTYEELESSTNKFDPKRKIGDGGFGSVFLGQLFDGRIVAVKYLHTQHHQKALFTKSFCNEILILSSITHPNLVKLHGYCSDPRGLLLVYDYVPNGTLADHLHGSKSLYRKASLTWQIRLDIALQTALAMEYLHFSVVPAIVHRDITSSNIFVEKDMRIKVGDFGLSRLLTLAETASSGYVWTGPQGTPGYLDPDYHRSFRLTDKSDVYSFGVVLLELISGLKAVDQSREKREMALADLMVSKIQMGLLHQVVDPVLALDEEAMDGVDAIAELSFRCVAADKDDRPDGKEIVEELKRIRSRTRGCCSSLRGSNSNVSDVAQ